MVSPFLTILIFILGEIAISGDQTTYQRDNNFEFWNHSSRGVTDNLDPKEYPFIEISTIKEATNNFSVTKKLGEGVFKVTTFENDTKYLKTITIYHHVPNIWFI